MIKRLLTTLCIPAALLLCALAACAAPQLVQDEASMYIRNPKCLEIFLGFGYQRYTHALVLRPDVTVVVFALGEDETGNYQSCAAVDWRMVGIADHDQLVAMAIARCNAFGARWGINCKLFAVNNKIVWGKEEDVEFQ